MREPLHPIGETTSNADEFNVQIVMSDVESDMFKGPHNEKGNYRITINDLSAERQTRRDPDHTGLGHSNVIEPFRFLGSKVIEKIESQIGCKNDDVQMVLE
jgi:hypothetical protein